MRGRTSIAAVVAGVSVAGFVTQCQAQAEVAIETVTVGNPGNPGDPQFDGTFGRVDYVYRIGKYEVTAGQYAAFLNAVAATDTNALYDTRMWTHAEGCRIERTGSPGSYTYSVAPDWAERPVNFVGFGDGMRLANWLHNGQPAGAQNLTTTEDGSYFLNGKANDEDLQDVGREPDATWVMPSEHEWYKAAYHMNDGVTGNYFFYPTSSDIFPKHPLIDPDPGNNATVNNNGNYTIGPPYYRTLVGAHENSESPYGTFDQGGNLWEFNESVPLHNGRGIRGGAYNGHSDSTAVWVRPIEFHSSDQFSDIGLRLANLSLAPSCSVFVAPDSDHDCDVDADDLDALMACASRAATPVAPGCEDKDFDGDNDSDLTDFAIFQRCYSGQDNPAVSSCAD
jgi:formylglycine-generating enzyme required for sulfatase activity